MVPIPEALAVVVMPYFFYHQGCHFHKGYPITLAHNLSRSVVRLEIVMLEYFFLE